MAEYIGIEGPYRTRKGYWVCEWTDPQSKRRCQRHLGPTSMLSRADAQQAKLAWQETVVANPALLSASGLAPTLNEWADLYLAGRPRLSKATVKGYRDATAHMVRVFGADRRLNHVTKLDAKALRANLEALGRAAYTVKGVLTRCRTMFAEALDSGVIGRNPFVGVSVAASVDKAWDRPTLAEFWRIMQGWGDSRAACMFALARLAGLRANETAKVRWSDVDWDKRTIVVHAPERAARGGQERTTKRRMRVVPLVPELHDILWRAFTDRGSALHDPIGTKQDLGYKALGRRLDDLGIPVWPDLFQACRQMRLTEWADQRVPVATIAAWAGNSVEVAEKHYIRVTSEAIERVTRPRLAEGA